MLRTRRREASPSLVSIPSNSVRFNYGTHGNAHTHTHTRTHTHTHTHTHMRDPRRPRRPPRQPGRLGRRVAARAHQSHAGAFCEARGEISLLARPSALLRPAKLSQIAPLRVFLRRRCFFVDLSSVFVVSVFRRFRPPGCRLRRVPGPSEANPGRMTTRKKDPSVLLFKGCRGTGVPAGRPGPPTAKLFCL